MNLFSVCFPIRRVQPVFELGSLESLEICKYWNLNIQERERDTAVHVNLTALIPSLRG